MPSWISGAIEGVATFFDKTKDWVMLYLARRSGRSSERSDMRKEANEIKEDQLEIAAEKPANRDEIIEDFENNNL